MENILALKNIKTAEQLNVYLNTVHNAYTQFILEKRNRDLSTLKGTGTFQDHHIIPKHAGGCNSEFNLITLTYDEHTQAHVLLHQVYGQASDALVVKIRTPSTNSKTDSKWPLSWTKSNYSKYAFQKGTIWVSDNGHRLIFGPGQISGLGPLSNVLAEESAGWKGTKYEDTLKSFYKNPKNSVFYRNLNKLISGFREKERGNIYKAGPWHLEGILVQEAEHQEFLPYEQKESFDSFPMNFPHHEGKGKKDFFNRITSSGKDLGFVCTGLISYETASKSQIEFFCKNHQLFINRSWSYWNRCFKALNLSWLPPCCLAQQNNTPFNLVSNPSVSLTSKFKNLPKEAIFSESEQEEILKKLARPKGPQPQGIIDQITKVKIQEKMAVFGHTLVGDFPERKAEICTIYCSNHNETVVTSMQNYLIAIYGTACCAKEHGRGSTGYKKNTKFRKKL